ncbi:MAG TPA: hypothetical protein VK489_04975 [Ferruginibacter sp.]|nr:hypothetical protein [Ferruginibacter sp.]
MKAVIMILLAFSASTQVNAQDTVFVYIDNEKAAQAITDPLITDVNLELKKVLHKRSKSFIVQIYGEHIKGGVYRRDLEIAGDTSIIMTETSNTPGLFDISQSDTKKRLLTGKPLKLYLLLNPANPQMALPSRRVYLGTLVMK